MSLEISQLRQRVLGTYMRVTVNKGIDKCTFTLSEAMNFDSADRQLVRSK